ncbi:hypothetical protein ABID12_002952 [Martelella mangrovi]|uniref:Uncharacterized protein n=1 Tax=Martelella mangrovi TaxID=1397477 RepID=A0ABV2IDK1_9HYPH
MGDVLCLFCNAAPVQRELAIQSLPDARPLSGN